MNLYCESLEQHQQLDAILNTLPEMERKVLKMRYGFVAVKPMTLEAIGKALGITRERVRNLEGKGLRKLRKPERLNKLDFD